MSEAIPKRVGIIMDGNRRWAKTQGLPTLRGHMKGQQTLHRLAHHAFEQGVEHLSVYAFSTENWQRTQNEVGYLMRQVTAALAKYVDEFVEQGVRIRFLGSREGLDVKVLAAIERAESLTAGGTAATLAVCFNYGGQQEIVDATRALIGDGMAVDDITPESFADYLYQPDVPPMDLLIRTGGEQRLSNFMLWRAAYAELMFTDTLWPDFSDDEFAGLLADYAKRTRRFGK